jgi:serine/threonine protein kinase
LGLQVGDRVGDYRVIGLLGSGGMGAVYQVRHLISERVEAMKILLPDLSSSADLAERFIREIRLQASLSHPNIAALLNAFRVENQLMMVMEFVDGENLSERIRRGPLHIKQVLDISEQMLSALAYAHASGVVHRDIKPANIIVTPSATVKLMDFGIAQGDPNATHLTQTGTALGSLYYMSPEQVRAEPADGRSDIYATGITMFEMLTGERPFKGTAAAVLQAQLNEPAPSPSVMNPAVPNELSGIVLKALHKNPAKRYQNADEIRTTLLEFRTHFSDSKIGTGSKGASTSPTVSFKNPQTSSSNSITFDPIGLERLRKELAPHIGPMAKVIVDRAASRARSWEQLYEDLAREIPAGKERDRFLTQRPRP